MSDYVSFDNLQLDLDNDVLEELVARVRPDFLQGMMNLEVEDVFCDIENEVVGEMVVHPEVEDVVEDNVNVTFGEMGESCDVGLVGPLLSCRNEKGCE